MTVAQSDPIEVPWESCSRPGCSGVPAQAGLCLAHVRRRDLAKAMDPVRRGRSLDARGVTISSDLLAAIVEAAPLDVDGNPKIPKARFDHATFPNDVSFEGSVFAKDVSFDRSRFEGDATFGRVRFHGNARFAGATFSGQAVFDEAVFGGQAWFGGSAFNGPASFREAQFANLAWFGRAVFTAGTSFAVANFCNDATFDGIEVAGDANFTRAIFRGEARIANPSFSNNPDFAGATFLGKGGPPRIAIRQAGWSGGRLASWPSRVAATAIDKVVTSLVTVAPVPVGVFLERALLYNGALRGSYILGALLGMLFVIRNLVTQGSTGQTLGKRRMEIKVVREGDGAVPGRTRSILRQLAHVLDSLPMLAGWLWPLWDGKHQTFADKVCRTVVVRS